MKNWVVLVGIIVFALAVSLNASFNRYTIVGVGQNAAYKIDKLTGKVTFLMEPNEAQVEPIEK